MSEPLSARSRPAQRTRIVLALLLAACALPSPSAAARAERARARDPLSHLPVPAEPSGATPMAAPRRVKAEDVPVQPPGPTALYVIQPGDSLSVKFRMTPELDTDLPVRPDGRISLPLAPDVVAAGRTPGELEADIRQRLEGELRDPEVAVIVRTFTAYKVHVGGEVRAPGVIDLAGPRSVIQAIFEAGGFTDVARMSQVLVVRRGAGRPIVLEVDAKAALFGSDTTQDIALMPNDAVFVPRTRIANVNRWVDQYIRKNLPVPFAIRTDPL